MRIRPVIATATALTVGAVAVAGLAAGGTEAAATRTVRVDDNRFSPSRITVRVGTTVTWKWVGTNEHDVRVVKGPKRFHSDLMHEGQYRQRFTRKGTYRIVCDPHRSFMTMTVVVR